MQSFPGFYFPVFVPNTGKYRPEKTPYLDTFHTVHITAHPRKAVLHRKLKMFRKGGLTRNGTRKNRGGGINKWKK